MVFDIRMVSQAVDKVTVEIIAGVIWNMERLKNIIEIFAENESHRLCLKEIEDIPLSVFLSQHLYKLNGDIRRLCESKINDVSEKFGKRLWDLNCERLEANFRPSFNGIRRTG